LARNQKRLDRYFFEIIFEVVELIRHSIDFSTQARALDRHAGEVVNEGAALTIVFAEKNFDRRRV
jgi:hypothetical protein